MGFRFRRRLRVLPGVSLNLSKSGVSASIGGRGATLNLNERGVQSTVGLPGSGLSYRSARRPWGYAGQSGGAGMAPAIGVLILLAILVAIAVFG